MVEKDSLVKVGTIKEEIKDDMLDKGIDSEEKNPYRTMIINGFEKNSINIDTS